MLRGAGVARGEISLEEIDAGGRTVTLRIVARWDGLDDLFDITAGAEIAGERDEDIGTIARGAQKVFVDRHGAGEILGLELFAGGEQARFHTRRRAFRRDLGRRRRGEITIAVRGREG